MLQQVAVGQSAMLPQGLSQSTSQIVPQSGTLSTQSKSETASSTSTTRSPENLPGNGEIKLFKDASIPDEIIRKYLNLRKVFTQALLDSNLSDLMQRIAFDIGLAGVTLGTAHPSMIVWCPAEECDDLQKLLRRSQIVWLLKKPRLVLETLSQMSIFADESRPNTKIKVLYAPYEQEWLMERPAGTGKVFTSSPWPSSTLCGVLVIIGSRLATITCVISIDSRLFAVTVAHVLRKRRPRTKKRQWHGEVLRGLNLWPDSYSEDHNILESKLDDIWSEQPSSSLQIQTSYKTQRDPSPREIFDRKEASKTTISSNLVGEVAHEMMDQIPEHTSDDWTLIALEREFHLPNIAHYGDAFAPTFIGTGVSEQPYVMSRGKVLVRLVSGVNGDRRGRLLPHPTFIGTAVPGIMSETYTLVLDDGRGVAPGECGSPVVVPSESGWSIVGHIVAVNPLGEACVFLLTNVFSSIIRATGCHSIKLYNGNTTSSQEPLELLRPLAYSPGSTKASIPYIGRPRYEAQWDDNKKAYCYVDNDWGTRTWDLPPGATASKPFFPLSCPLSVAEEAAATETPFTNDTSSRRLLEIKTPISRPRVKLGQW